jgi:hypothetical protein
MTQIEKMIKEYAIAEGEEYCVCSVCNSPYSTSLFYKNIEVCSRCYRSPTGSTAKPIKSHTSHISNEDLVVMMSQGMENKDIASHYGLNYDLIQKRTQKLKINQSEEKA